MQDTNSIYGLLKESAEKYAGKTAVLYDTFAGSYEKLFRDVTNKAIHLQHFEGKRVALDRHHTGGLSIYLVLFWREKMLCWWTPFCRIRNGKACWKK